MRISRIRSHDLPNIIQFCEDNHILSSRVLLPTNSCTYISEAWHTTSWLDHCISTADAHASLGCMYILYGVTTCEHIPLAMVRNAEQIPVLSRCGNSVNTEVLDWSTLKKEDISADYAHTDKSLGNIQLPLDAV